MAPALGGVACEGSEEEDAEQSAVGDGGDGEADLDDVAFAADLDAVDRDGKEDERPDDGGGAGDHHAFALVGVGSPVHIEVYDGGGGERVERGGEVRHRRGEDGCDEEAGDADGHLVDDEGREEAVRE